MYEDKIMHFGKKIIKSMKNKGLTIHMKIQLF